MERGTRRRRLRGGERKWVEGGGKSGVAPCETSRRSFAPRPARVYRECSNVCIARRVLHRTGSRAHSYGHFVAVYFGKFPVSTSTILLLLLPPLPTEGMVSSEWVARRGEFRNIRNNFAILARLNGGTSCSRGRGTCGFQGNRKRVTVSIPFSRNLCFA